MMRQYHILWSLLAATTVLMAQDNANLAFNGDFKQTAFGHAYGWMCPPAPYTTYHATGGPDGLPYVAMQQGDDDTYENKLRMKYITLVPGEPYRISAWIRTKDFSAKRGELLLVNNPWYKEVGIKKFPATTDGWQKFEKDVVCPEKDSGGDFDIVLLIIGQRGELDVADIRLTALSEVAIEKSRSTEAVIVNEPRLIPWGRSFDEIPVYKPEIEFIWYGRTDEKFKAEDHLAEAVAADGSFTSQRVKFEAGKPFVLNVKELPIGKHQLAVRLVSQTDGKIAYEEPFGVNIRNLSRPEEVTKGLRLNNLAVELVNKPVAAGENVSFTLEHDSWIYLTIKNLEKNKDFGVMLDGQAIGVDTLTNLPEAFRLLTAGKHVVKANCAGRLVIRSIAELFSCGMVQGPDIAVFPPFDWEFTKKYALNAVTPLNRGSYGKNGKEMVDAAHANGRIWLEDMYVVNNKDVESMTNFMERAMAKLDFRDGNTTNEMSYWWSLTQTYTSALKRCNYNHSKLIYTWIGDNAPFIPSMHQDFIGASFNASDGRGKILCESYNYTQPTEEAARRHVLGRILPYIEDSCRYYPDYLRRSGVILGNFNQLNVITIEHHPQVDFKYYLDMQMNILANHPAFEGLGTVGYWGMHYADEELYRWSHALLRHYVVEGRKDMLSKQFGFNYIPGHIVNGDFAEGLSGWKAEAAADDAIAVEKFSGYAKRNQNRWNAPRGCGDSFCVFKAVEGKPNKLSQIAKGLTVGKPYMLLFSVGDYDDLKQQKLNPRRYGLEAVLENAEILPESTVYIDKREKGKYAHNHNVARQNLHRIIFIPKSAEMTVTFTDVNAQPGENLMVNYIQLKPFYPSE